MKDLLQSLRSCQPVAKTSNANHAQKGAANHTYSAGFRAFKCVRFVLIDILFNSLIFQSLPRFVYAPI